MITLKFKCTLLSDVILNQKAATVGPNKTLDFIPGNCFLGIAASQLYNAVDSSTSWEMFHSGKVRFGDAHPSANGVRGLKIPLSMFSPKLSKSRPEIYILHRTDKDVAISESLKQIREGFYTYADRLATKVKTETNYAVKSAYDRVNRRSKDEQMFGYESLAKGLELYFDIEVDNDGLADIIRKAIVGNKNVGRSRTAQFGSVKIEEYEYQDVPSSAQTSDIIEVYADSRLIFLDEFGIPKLRPTASDLGLEGEIDWSMTQIRTFQYAPWNFKRAGFDTERCGIEKGSVIVVRTGLSDQEFRSTYVGAYRNEGFGKVIYNPCFLAAEKDGKALYKLPEKTGCAPEVSDKAVSDTILYRYLDNKYKDKKYTAEIYELVNTWVKDGHMKFRSASFASQWGSIRNLALQSFSLVELKQSINSYLTHGVASAKWKERDRLKWLNRFLDEIERYKMNNEMPDRYAIMAVINLSSEMAKKYRSNDYEHQIHT